MVCLGQLTLASFRFLLHLDAVRSMIALDLVKLAELQVRIGDGEEIAAAGLFIDKDPLAVA